MACKHRFYDQLIPKIENIKYVFVGTFNPEWNSENNNAEYFYDRSTNNFWCIMPHAFSDNCLIDKGISEWSEYCIYKKIVITDLVSEILNANEIFPEHKDLITRGYSDSNLEKKVNGKGIFEMDFNTNNIIEMIEKNRNSLKGVFFTRKTRSGIPRLWKEWEEIKNNCKRYEILAGELITPSNYGPGIKDSIVEWKKVIFQ